MERNYIAFISYRHQSLDREAAERVQKRIENYIVPKEFREKTMPVLQHYNDLGLLIRVNGDQTREAVFAEIIDRLYHKASL